MRVLLPASHPMLSRGRPEGENVTPYSHYDTHDAPASGKRGRRAPCMTVLAVLAAFALFVAYHEELRRALSAAEDELRDGTSAISLEEASQLKQSLRDITTRLSRSDRDQLGALVDAAEKGTHAKAQVGGSSDVAGDVAQAIDAGTSLGFGSSSAPAPQVSFHCGSACMDALASKLPEKKSGPANDMGKYDVGDELEYRRDQAASSAQLKGSFLKAQRRKMDEAVKRGWADLKEGKTSDAREELKEAKSYHSSELRLMRGSPDIADHLGTPKKIRRLADGIDEAKGSIQRTPGKLSKIMEKTAPSKPSSTLGKDEHTRGDGIPKKLEAIMEKRFRAADDNVRRHALSRISRHFRSGSSYGHASSAWTPGGAASVTLPRAARHTSHDAGLDGNFIQLTRNALERGRVAVNDGMYHDAHKALSKARMFLSSLKDAQARERRKERRGGAVSEEGNQVRDEADQDRLGLEVTILAHAVSNLGQQRQRTEQEQLQKNLRVLHAPIQDESMAAFTGGAASSRVRRADRRFVEEGTADPLRGSSSSTRGSRIQGDDRALFSVSIRHGVDDARRGEIARAQAKLVEARYYANRDGLLRDNAEMGDRQIRNMHVAKRALKLLARDIVSAEQRLQNPVRSHGRDDRLSLSRIMGLRVRRRRRVSRRRGELGNQSGGRERLRKSSAARGEEGGRRWGGAMARALDKDWGVVGDGDDGAPSEDRGAMVTMDKAIDRALADGANRRVGAQSGAEGTLMGALSRGGNWWKHKISHQGPDGGEELAGSGRSGARRRGGALSAAKRWVGMYDKGSNLLTAANGEQEADRLADKRAKKDLDKGCNSLNCLFDEAASAQNKDGMGISGAPTPGTSAGLALGGGSKGLTADDFGKAKTATHTGMHYSYRLDHLSMTHGGSGIPKMHTKDGVNVPGQGDVGPDVKASKLGKSGNSLASRRSTRDTDVEVRAQEANDLKKSMQEAMLDYKKLLRHEVKKEELRTVNDPTLAIETPVGKPLLPSLSGSTDSNPAKLELSALRQRQANQHTTKGGKPAPSAAQALESKETSAGATGDSAQALMAHLLTKAKFEGGPWDAQEASPEVAAAKTGDGGAAAGSADDDHFAPDSSPAAVAASAAAVQPAGLASDSAPLRSRGDAQPASRGAARAVSQAAMDRLPGPAPPERARGGAMAAEARGRSRLPSLARESKARVDPVDVAGMLVTDIGKDLGF